MLSIPPSGPVRFGHDFQPVRFGHTFQFVPYSAIDSHPKTRRLVLKGYDLTKRTPKFIKPSNRLVGHPFTLEQTKSSSRPLYSPDAVVCTILRYGHDKGKQRVAHLDPNAYLSKTFDELVAMVRGDIQAHRQRQKSKKPYTGVLLGGARDYTPSVTLKNAIETAFRLEGIPFSKIWGQPLKEARQTTGIMTLPKVAQGVTLIGCAGGLHAVTDGLTPKTKFDPQQAVFKDLLRTSGLPERDGDVLVTEATLPDIFSEVQLLPQHELRVGETTLIGKGQCRLNPFVLQPSSAAVVPAYSREMAL